jgi:GT2 family glycosyltransferase
LTSSEPRGALARRILAAGETVAVAGKEEGRADLSILIVNYDTVGILRECLASIYQHPPSLCFEVLVVDNGSPDGSGQMVRQEFPQVRLLSLGENTGFARANNLALQQARGRLLLLLNSDTRVLKGSIDGLVAAMEEHPQAGAMGCKHLDARSCARSCTGACASTAARCATICIVSTPARRRWTGCRGPV